MPVQELRVLHHVGHYVLALVVEVSRVSRTDETLVLAVIPSCAHRGQVFADFCREVILFFLASGRSAFSV